MDELKGLTIGEVKERQKKGLVNGNFSIKTKSVWQIIFTNVFTLFNLINLLLALCLFLVDSYKNMMFLGVVAWNILIGVVQEIRSKRIIDKLSLLSAPDAVVIRDGKEQKTDIENIVLDDIIMLKSGNQVCVDGCILKGECEVNESLLTGESEPVYKKAGDEVLSGSYIISGSIIAKTIHVGRENYVNKITSQAKYLKRPNSEILKSIRFIIRGVSAMLVPIGVLLLLNQIEAQGFKDAVVGAVAGVLGMIPSGLVLLTSVVLAVSVIRLGMKNTLVQELYCIETLARVDVLCLDKTGTITEGTMSVEGIESFGDNDFRGVSLETAVYEFTKNLHDDNPTFNALWKYSEEELKHHGVTGKERRKVFDNVIEEICFSSDKKWSLIEFEHHGVFVLGAMEFMFDKPDIKLKEKVEKYAGQGLRVLVFAHSYSHSSNKNLPPDLKPVGIIVLSDTIRKEAKETFKYFINQGVNIKVISGDNPCTVSYVAKKAGVLNAEKYIDATLLATEEDIKKAAEEYTVFGRVTPNQKLMLIKALKSRGHTVAMTGDGVNDVMALKEADCSIAMQSGSDAARNVSQLVLMDSDFSAMPDIVAEGRRTINNLQRSASLYLTKTIYSTILAIMFVILPTAYPFIPIQMTFIGSLAIGIPSFILAMEPNLNRVKGKFLVNVLKLAIPGALLVVTNVTAVVVFDFIFDFSREEFSAMCLYGLAIAALLQLMKCCKPFNKLRHIMCIVLIALFIFGTTFFKGLLDLASMNYIQGIFITALIFSSCVLYIIYSVLVGKIMGSVPNIYKIHLMYSEKERIVLVEDDVERKDYYDVSAQMKGLKVLSADEVAYIKKADEGGNIRVETAGRLPDMSVLAGAARYYVKKKKLKGENIRVDVETDYFNKPVATYVTLKEHTVKINQKDFEEIGCGNEADNVKKIRYLKKLRLTF